MSSDTPPSHLDSTVLGGALWSTLGLFAARGTGFIVQVVLARLLMPDDFGVVGMAAIFTDILGTVGDLGLVAALVQMRQDRLRDDHLDTAFWVSVLFGTGAFIVFALVVGPLAADFYAQPSLRMIVPALAFGEWLRTFGIINRVTLARELRFKALSLIESSAAMGAGAVAIGMAYGGAGAWSIIVQSVLATAIALPLLWKAVPWRPSLSVSGKALSDISGYGVYDVSQRTVNYFTHNIDYLLVGKLLGATELGIYTVAFVVTDTFRQQLMAVANKVLFPVYGRIQDDVGWVKRLYLKAIRYNGILVTGPMLLLLYFARPLITVLLGDKWLLAVFPIQVMALASILHAIGGTTESVLRGTGRVGLNFWVSLGKTLCVTIPAFLIGISYFGIDGAAVAVLVHKGVSRFIYQHLMKKFIGVDEREILCSIRPILLGAMSTVPAGWAAWSLLDLYNPLVLVTTVLLTGGIYAVVVYLSDIPEFSLMIRVVLDTTRRSEKKGPGGVP